jgi:hypothetical protein
MNFQTRWETTDMEQAAEGNNQAERSSNLHSVLEGLDYYNSY